MLLRRTSTDLLRRTISPLTRMRLDLLVEYTVMQVHPVVTSDQGRGVVFKMTVIALKIVSP